ncbi:HEXXH motif-containing putative peptide modification protein [Limnohabitans sp. WS1]|uniref:aKG-HExxH-type peptide beta-hydroxylase n=1 Tax=Limnohabitans sp. WS1 TaxID=1100726 RepID=UPI000D39727F|nr:HEXXH motif-containing putative peptide modification protein [Limnohabitans sp. WS1]PUE19304.1 hypothetical protein B9Z48_05675 [Limnohabitans sp. WS1]
MPEKLIQLVPPQVLHEASGKAFQLRLRHFFETYRNTDSLSPPELSDLLQSGVLEWLSDSATLRAWMWSISRLAFALRSGGVSIAVDTLDHLRVDKPHKSRVSELLYWQLLGIVVGQALHKGVSFSVSSQIPPPERIQLDKFGKLELLLDRPVGAYSLRCQDGVLIFSSPGMSLKLDAPSSKRTQNYRFTPLHWVTPEVYLAYDNDALCRPFFQPLPMLVGNEENRRLEEQISRCWTALNTSDIDGVSHVLALCESIIGLVSLTESIGSASREEALGLVFLPAGTDDINVGECLLHEGLHQLLFRIEEAADLFTPDTSKGENFYSPWRTDGRPLRMVFHGAFVFSGIASMHLHLQQSMNPDLKGSLEEAFRRMEQSALAMETVRRHAQLTPVGMKVAAAIDAQIESVRGQLPTNYESVREAIRKRPHDFPVLLV